jgi:hypothetical protein
MDCGVPVTVAVNISAPFPESGAIPVRVEDVKLLVLRVGCRLSDQNRSRTPWSAPSETSWTVSSFRPGWISRRTTAWSSIRY